MTIVEFSDWLIKTGWKIENIENTIHDDKMNYIKWSAYKRLVDVPHCECNERCPSIILKPYSFHQSPWTKSFDLSLTAEFSGEWYNFMCYGISLKISESKFNSLIKNLIKSWVNLSKEDRIEETESHGV